MKIIAYHLPQFHEVEENNQWWGNGFTEWDNVKKAQPLFRGHIQPRIPLSNNYYDLLKIDNLKNQFKIANTYGIYGFCFYQYWFEGRMLLEKPAEMLIKNKEIEGNFCFCWANHTWRKTWNKTNHLLIEQTYGNQEEWLKHLEYLLPFFKDHRYIKVDNKPIFLVYDLSSVKNHDERFDFYNEYLINHGFSGIELIQSINNRGQKLLSIADAYTLREPAISHFDSNSIFKKIERKLKKNKNFNLFFKPLTYSFEKISNNSLIFSNEFIKNNQNCKIYLGLFREWDSTPRHGKHGFIINRADDDSFIKYCLNIDNIISNNHNVSDFVFYNAWNEWGETCYLEPDEHFGFNTLECINLANKVNIK
ncbi:glycoside hydrolase family 99-like domain-containing protein [Providencia rettgeri]